MSWEVQWTRRAIKDARNLDVPIRERVVEAVGRLAMGQGDVRVLQGASPPEWRLRVGDWRVRFTYVVEHDHDRDEDVQVIRILRVLPRGRAYRD
jgi:mRNA interferase RelE/StbE